LWSTRVRAEVMIRLGRHVPAWARREASRGFAGTSEKTLQELWAGGLPLTQLAEESCRRAANADRNEWIYRIPEDEVLQQAKQLEQKAEKMSQDQRRAELPLLGTTFAAKDNLEAKGYPTTNGMDCRPPRKPAAVAHQSAAVVQRLQDMGALLVGKTNMDCAATGLVGVRSAYGACQNSFDRAFISGGSSSGSGVAVALGQVSFSLGTDTAGSGRVPAALNNIVGLKASRGLISTHGLRPACKSIDCVSVFSLTTREAQMILEAAAPVSGAEPWDRPAGALPSYGPRLPLTGPAKFTFAVPKKEFVDFDSFGTASRASGYREAWERSVESLKAVGGTCVEIDYSPFQEAADLLYQGPYVAERLSAMSAQLTEDAEAPDPTVRKIAEMGYNYSAQQCFEAMYRMQELKRASEAVMKASGAQVLVTPTVGATYTIEDVLADPIALNSHLGRYTNHMNLLDLCGISVPTAFAEKLPFSVTISAEAGHDAFICDVADRLHLAAGLQAGATASAVTDVAAAVQATSGEFLGPLLPGVETFEVAVCGAHMAGLALCWQLLERSGRFMRKAKTSPRYRLVAFDGMKPPRPGLVDSASGASIELEIWELPVSAFGSFMKLVASPLGIGWIELEDGTRIQGFRQVDVGADRNGAVAGGSGAPPDITEMGSWRTYLQKH